MAGYIGKNVQVASTSSTVEGRALMEAQSVAEQRTLLDVDSKAEADAKNAALQTAMQTYSDNNSIGVGQTWQDVTASRTAGVTYTNTTGKPIIVSTYLSGSGSSSHAIIVDGVACSSLVGTGSVSAIVPNGANYSLINPSGRTIIYWSELR